MTLNEKIVEILRQHPEGGEKFFNALDFMIRSDRDILKEYITWVEDQIKSMPSHWGVPMNYDVGVIVTGRFGRVLLSNSFQTLSVLFRDIIVIEGGLREGKVPEIPKSFNDFKTTYYVLLDDSFYSGSTTTSILKAIRDIRNDISIVQALVVYDGSKENKGLVSSMYRYYE